MLPENKHRLGPVEQLMQIPYPISKDLYIVDFLLFYQK